MANSPIPAEVAFDRYLRTHTPYRGKQDLERLSQVELRSLLGLIQQAFTLALANEKQDVPEHVDHLPIHFDFIDSDSPNAHAFCDEAHAYAYIGVTMSLVYQLGEVSVAISRSEEVTDLLNVPMTVAVRDGLHAMLFQTLWTFVAGHEYAHIVHGHSQQRGERSVTFSEFQDKDEIGDLDDQIMELDADGYGGVYHVLSNLFRDDARKHALSALQIDAKTEGYQDEVLLCCFVVAVGGFLFARPPVDVKTADVYKLTHPPQLVRLNYIMEHAIGWCRQNRPALVGWMTPPRFRMLMQPVASAIWGPRGGESWKNQIAFLESEPGKEYVRKLGENLRAYVGAL